MMNSLKKYVVDLQHILDNLPLNKVQILIDLLHDARLNNQQVFIMGNGGSASTASHFVCDLGKNTHSEGWPRFRVLGLTDNMASFSAYANDEGYEMVFAQQLAALAQSNDIVIAISTSGNSPNVLKAIEVAARKQAKTVGFTGFDGGSLAQMVDLNIHIDSNCIEHVEDVHLMLEHMICKELHQKVVQQKNGVQKQWS